MADIIPGPRPLPKLRFVGVFDFDGLYDLIVGWFKANKYDFKEMKYELKPTKPGKEIKVEWYGEKKVTTYLKYVLDIYIIVFAAEKVEIVENGIKKKRMKGRLEIRIEAQSELDYQGRWETSEFNMKLRKFMHKYLLYWYINFQVWDPFYYKIYGLLTKMKKFLNMETSYNAY